MKTNIIQLSNGKWQFNSPHAFVFDNGQTLANLSLVYETYGHLNADRSNAILIHHALSTHSHVASHANDNTPGWWEKMVGRGCPIDTDRYFVICINNLGSCFGSTGPASINPMTKKVYAMDFPELQISDIARSQKCLLDYLGIEQLHAIIGPSMGAMMSLYHAYHYPESVKKFISISSCYRSYPSNIALRTIQREIIQLDQAWQQGHYENNAGFILARKLAHLTYRNTEELNHRFVELEKQAKTERNIHSYLQYNAEKFVNKFNVNSYLYLTKAMDDFNILETTTGSQPFIKQIQAQSLIISVNSDTLFEPFQQQELFQLLENANIDVEFVDYESNYGHDAFLVETQGMGKIIHDFLTP